MTPEQKQLLLKDFCGRLPYGVKVKYLYWDENKGCEHPIAMVLDTINSDGYIRFHGDIAEGEGRGLLTQNLPYLRPMSSMTEEEYKSVSWEGCSHTYNYSLKSGFRFVEIKTFTINILNWLNAHHFDYRGLIEKGLALEAPEDMYKTK